MSAKVRNFWLIAASALAWAAQVVAAPSTNQCRCFPGDACWPCADTWAQLNQSIGGALVATTPLAAPCHNDPFAPYDAAECQKLQDGWLEPQTQ